MHEGSAEDDTLAGPATPPSGRTPIAPTPGDPAAATRRIGLTTAEPRETSAALAAGTPKIPSGRPAWIGRFVVFDELGAGGMGQVFAAYDPELDRKIALKLVQRPPNGAGTGDWQARLVREAQAMAKLSHPNVVTVYEVGAHAGELFLAMELVEGRDLARWLGARSHSWREILDVFRAAGEGLAAAHGVGLVHRDFKPANVLVGDDGRVRVADFGLVHTRTARALALRESGSHSSDVFARDLTHYGALMGTPAYMAPEQLSGEATDERSDVFSFCVALWEALYGQRPFGGETMADRLSAIRRGELREPPASVVPRWLRPLLLKGLADEPGGRWPGMRPLLDALAHDPEQERARRRRATLRAVIVLTLGGALVFGGSLLWSQMRERARERAAQLDLDATMARIESLRAEGRTIGADAMVDAFVAAPEHQRTRAQVRALLWRAEQRRSEGDIDGALDGYSEAYAAAQDPGQAEDVLFGLATLFRERREWGPLTWVLASLTAMGPETQFQTLSLRLDAALYQRDFATVAHLDESLAPLAAALGQAQITNHLATRAESVDLEGDGLTELALYDSLGPTSRVNVARTRVGLPSLGVSEWSAGATLIDRAVSASSPGPAHFIGRTSDDERQLLVWRDGLLIPEASWVGSVALDTASGDLDGDGSAEIYVGTGPYNRRLFGLRREGDGWAKFTPLPAIDASESDVNALAIADVDGDGREELLVGLGPWNAFDLRILRPGPPGHDFVQLARHKLGHIEDVAVVRGPDGPLIAVAKSSQTLYAAPEMFPDGDHTGVAPGLYLFRVREQGIEQVGFAPVEGTARLRHLVVADIDGDGRAELVGDIAELNGPGHDLEIFRLGSDSLSRVRIGRLIPLAAASLDADPADELVVADAQGEHRVWTLGVGSQSLPQLDLGRPKLAAPPPEALAEDLPVRRQWVQAGELAGLGLLSAAGRRYAELARALPRGDARRAAFVQAAELALSAGELALAAGRFEEAARNSGRTALFERAADNYERSGRFDDAIRVLGESSITSPNARSRIDRHAAWLASELDYRFDRPLDAAWLLRDPLALRHDRIRGVLIADLMNPEPVLSLPVYVDSDVLLRFEFSLAEIGYGSSFAVRLLPESGGAPALEVSVYRSGSAGSEGAQLFVRWVPDDPALAIPLPGPSDRVTLEIGHLPASAEQRLAIAVNDVPAGEARRATAQRFGGPAQLHLLRSDPLGGAARTEPWARIELRRVVTRGLTTTMTPHDPFLALRRALVEGESGQALASLAAVGSASASPELPLWRVLALVAADDIQGASQVLHDSLDLEATDSPVYRGTLRLLRTRSERFAAVVRSAVGAGYLQLFHDTWAASLRHEPAGDFVTRALHEHGPELDRVEAPDVPGLHVPLPELRATLRLARAASYARLQHATRAHDEIKALDQTELTSFPGPSSLLRDLLYHLAVLDLAEGRLDHVFEHLEAARTLSIPEMFADRLRVDPELISLRSDPRWSRLVSD